jgi:hypothetical protein
VDAPVSDFVLSRVDGHVGWLTLNDPARLTAAAMTAPDGLTLSGSPAGAFAPGQIRDQRYSIER